MSKIYRNDDSKYVKKYVKNKDIKYKQTAISNHIKTPYKQLKILTFYMIFLIYFLPKYSNHDILYITEIYKGKT